MCNTHLDPPTGSKNCFYSFFCPFPTEVSSRPKRNRISCHATLYKAAFAPFRKEGRMTCDNATKFHRKSGAAKWRDLLFILRSIQFEWKRYPLPCVSSLSTEVSSRPERSEWRDLQFSIPHRKTQWKHNLRLCHPDRSVAQWRDLQFCGPLLEMFFSPERRDLRLPFQVHVALGRLFP
jgi:hypothetical protein